MCKETDHGRTIGRNMEGKVFVRVQCYQMIKHGSDGNDSGS